MYYNQKDDIKTIEVATRRTHRMDNRFQDRYNNYYGNNTWRKWEREIEKSLTHCEKDIDRITSLANTLVSDMWESYDSEIELANKEKKTVDFLLSRREEVESEINSILGNTYLQRKLVKFARWFKHFITHLPQWVKYYSDKWFDNGLSVQKPNELNIVIPEDATLDDIKKVIHWAMIGASFYEYLSGTKFPWEETCINELTGLVELPVVS